MSFPGLVTETDVRALAPLRPHSARLRPFCQAQTSKCWRRGCSRQSTCARSQRSDGPSSSSPSIPDSTAPVSTAQRQAEPNGSGSPTGSLTERALAGSSDWAAFLGTLANSGAITGTLLDGIHSRVGLQVYDMAPLALGGLRTSLAVPPLLAAFYLVLGGLHPLMDNLNPSPETDAARARCADVGWVALSFGVLAALLYTSAVLYDQGVPYWQIHAVLGTAALINWRVFDGTRQGVALALLCGLGAPAAEVLLLQLVPLWHYPRADLGDTFVSWVFWCYFFYTPALGNLSRYLWTTMQEIQQAHREAAATSASALGAPAAAAAGAKAPVAATGTGASSVGGDGSNSRS